MGANTSTCALCHASAPEGRSLDYGLCPACSLLFEEVFVFHAFETEVKLLVVENHAISLLGIQQSENELIKSLPEVLAEDDPEENRSHSWLVQNFHSELRRAANHSALVSLVARLEHVTRKFVRELSLGTEMNRPPVTRDMEALNNALGEAPEPIEIFEKLVTARDSVIHADSQASWKHKGKLRCVANEYVNTNQQLDFNKIHLDEAVEKAIRQVNWYYKKVRPKRPL